MFGGGGGGGEGDGDGRGRGSSDGGNDSDGGGKRNHIWITTSKMSSKIGLQAVFFLKRFSV